MAICSRHCVGRLLRQQTAGIKFTQAKNQVFHPAPIQVKLGRADGHLGPLGCAKFHLNRRRGWEFGPQNTKNFHFLVKSHFAEANPLTDF